MKIPTQEKKLTTVATKITATQNDKLVILAKKQNLTKSSLIAYMIEESYKTITKNKTF